MGRSIAHWGLRFLVAALIYIAIVTVWINAATGWASLGVFVEAFIFGAMTMVAWLAAATIEQLRVRRSDARLIFHPVLTTVLFTLFAVVVLVGFMGDAAGAALYDAAPFAGLVFGSTVADAAAGVALERAAAARPPGPA